MKNDMGKKIRIVIMLVLLAVFLYSVIRLLLYYMEYQKQDARYEKAVENYIQELPVAEAATSQKAETCPITVDFDALFAESENVVGWLYCEDTNINYPVMQGEDNDYYLHHSYNGENSRAGAIFVDAINRPDFADSNTIIYGHHMKNGSMFAHLADWSDREFFEAHPVMWLLTPEQNYKVDLFAGFLTSAGSDTYTIFTGACPEFDDYLAEVLAASDVQTEVETPGDGHYIMLSTCEYNYGDARYVLHGMLTPA